ncbi:MAG TPA: PilN domain-containing protein [Gallionella sp.]|nr:PilN domain-containing protein [Gallionella sp.]
MTALWLDYQRNRPFHWAGPLLLVLVLAAVIAAVVYYVELSDKATGWEDKLARIEHDHGSRPAAGADSRGGAETSLEVTHANEVLHRLSLPWELLFRTVESAAGDGVTLLALEPDMEKRVVKISGEAKDFSAMLNYITQLEAKTVFGPVYLQSHEVQQQDPNRPVRFALLVVWRGKS